MVEKKLEEVIQKYDRKIALLGEKIRAKDVTIQSLEKNVPLRHRMPNKRKNIENVPYQLSASNRDNDANIQLTVRL